MRKLLFKVFFRPWQKIISVRVTESYLISTTNILQNWCSACSALRHRSRKCPRGSGSAGSMCCAWAGTGFTHITPRSASLWGSVFLLCHAFINENSCSQCKDQLPGFMALVPYAPKEILAKFSFVTSPQITFCKGHIVFWVVEVWQLPVYALGRTVSVAEHNRFVDLERLWFPRRIVGKNIFLAKMSMIQHPSLISGSHHDTCQAVKGLPTHE